MSYKFCLFILFTFLASGLSAATLTKAERKSLKIAAENGNVEAQFAYANSVLEGYRVKDSDILDAFDWYQRATNQGHLGAMVALGKFFVVGRGSIEQDKPRGIALIKRAAKGGNTDALVSVGWAYTYARGKDKTVNHAEAVRWYKKSADAGSTRAMVLLAKAHATGKGTAKNTKSALYWMKQAASSGDVASMMRLGDAYTLRPTTLTTVWDSIVTKNSNEAFKWYLKASQTGKSAQAMRALALVYRDGVGVAKSLNQTFYWYKEAMKKDDNGMAEFAMYHLTRTNVKGPTKLRDQLVWAILSNDRDNGNSLISLNSVKLSPKGRAEAAVIAQTCKLSGYELCPQSDSDIGRKILKTLEAQAQQGDVNSQLRIAEFYLNGLLTQKNDKRAFEWMKRASSQNSEEAQMQLGLFYLSGVGVPVDTEKALIIIRNFASRGYPKMQDVLGRLHLHGQAGLGIDKAKAIVWLALSSTSPTSGLLNMNVTNIAKGVGFKGTKEALAEIYNSASACRSSNYQSCPY